jgi:hypothetical protein
MYPRFGLTNNRCMYRCHLSQINCRGASCLFRLLNRSWIVITYTANTLPTTSKACLQQEIESVKCTGKLCGMELLAYLRICTSYTALTTNILNQKILFLHNQKVNFNQTWYKSSLGKGNFELFKQRPRSFFQSGDNHKNGKMGWDQLNIFFSRTTMPKYLILTWKLSDIMQIQSCSHHGPWGREGPQ